jgi:hypothetical protein
MRWGLNRILVLSNVISSRTWWASSLFASGVNTLSCVSNHRNKPYRVTDFKTKDRVFYLLPLGSLCSPYVSEWPSQSHLKQSLSGEIALFIWSLPLLAPIFWKRTLSYRLRGTEPDWIADWILLTELLQSDIKAISLFNPIKPNPCELFSGAVRNTVSAARLPGSNQVPHISSCYTITLPLRSSSIRWG